MTQPTNIKTFPPSGTRDFYPEDLVFRNWLFDNWKQVSKAFGCLEYDAPIVEHSELWTSKSDSDDILKEMYSFEKDGIKLTLRPEMTPSLTRMMLTYLPNAVLPAKFFSIPQCWRFENVSKGRRREFYQWNVDFFGAENVKSEIEIFMMIVEFIKRCGLTSNDVVIRISNRLIIQTVLEKLNIKNDKFVQIYNIIDKIEKLSKSVITKMLTDIGISDLEINVIYELIAIKTTDKLIKFLDETDIIYVEIKKLFEYAEKVGISEWLQLDLSIVRGLDYYTGIVFEGFSKSTEIKRAIFGGGRFDNMMEKYGYSEQVNVIGFGMGDCVIYEILKDLNKLPKVNLGVDYVIVPFNESYFADACNIASKIRSKGKSVDVYIKENKIKLAYSYADRKNADKVIFVAPTEWSNKQIVVKNLRISDKTIKQTIIDLDEYVNTL